MKSKLMALSLFISPILALTDAHANEGVARQVGALKTMMDSYVKSANDRMKDLEDSLANVNVCSAKGMLYMADAEAGVADEDGCSLPTSNGGVRMSYQTEVLPRAESSGKNRLEHTFTLEPNQKAVISASVGGKAGRDVSCNMLINGESKRIVEAVATTSTSQSCRENNRGETDCRTVYSVKTNTDSLTLWRNSEGVLYIEDVLSNGGNGKLAGTFMGYLGDPTHGYGGAPQTTSQINLPLTMNETNISVNCGGSKSGSYSVRKYDIHHVNW